jgi:hypothetical protein
MPPPQPLYVKLSEPTLHDRGQSYKMSFLFPDSNVERRARADLDSGRAGS